MTDMPPSLPGLALKAAMGLAPGKWPFTIEHVARIHAHISGDGPNRPLYWVVQLKHGRYAICRVRFDEPTPTGAAMGFVSSSVYPTLERLAVELDNFVKSNGDLQADANHLAEQLERGLTLDTTIRIIEHPEGSACPIPAIGGGDCDATPDYAAITESLR